MIATYLLRCADGSYYVGSTRDLDGRLAQHAAGSDGAYTATRLPIELVWHLEFDRIDEAWECERRLHGWSRLKKEALIAGRIELLPGLSRRGGPRRGLRDGR